MNGFFLKYEVFIHFSNQTVVEPFNQTLPQQWESNLYWLWLSSNHPEFVERQIQYKNLRSIKTLWPVWEYTINSLKCSKLAKVNWWTHSYELFQIHIYTTEIIWHILSCIYIKMICYRDKSVQILQSLL